MTERWNAAEAQLKRVISAYHAAIVPKSPAEAEPDRLSDTKSDERLSPLPDTTIPPTPDTPDHTEACWEKPRGEPCDCWCHATQPAPETDKLDYEFYRREVRPYIDAWVSQGGRNADMKHGVANFMTGQGLLMLQALITRQSHLYALAELEKLEALSWSDDHLDPVVNLSDIRDRIAAIKKEEQHGE